MKERALHSIMALALVLSMALVMVAAPAPVAAATVTFTGNVTADFTGGGILIIPDPGGVGDVGLPVVDPPPPGTISGWDMVDLRLTYNVGSDTLYVGINTYGIAGDADGDGNPGGTATWLANKGGIDRPDVGGTERICVFFDLDKDGTFDVIAGVGGGVDVTGFAVATFSGDQYNPLFGTDLPGNKGTYYASPSAGAPDFEFTILNFSTLPGQDSFLAGFRVYAFMGSQEDDGIGEDYIDYTQNPHTTATIVSSATTVVSGGSVSLNVTETNPFGAHNVSITSPQVAVTKNGGALATLNKASPYYTSGDSNGDGILDPGETWTWTNIPSGAITGLTTFVARGSGVAPGDFPVNYQTDPLEEDQVQVDTINPDTITTISANATKVKSGDTVDLTVTEDNTGDDPLTSPYVEVRQGATLIHTLNKASAYYTSGDTNGDGILDTTETWTWTNVPSDPINAATTFEALGFGTDSLGNEVSYAEGYLDERDTVDVDTIEPDTITTITSSAATVYSGDTVDLTVTEDNTGDDPLTSPYVEVRQGATLIHTLNKASPYYTSGDTNGNGILDTTETWTWTNVPSNPINAATTFEALGFGTDSLGNEVSYAEGNLDERDTVDVDTIEPDTITTITSSAATVLLGDTVDLTVTEDNTGDDPLTSPYVEVRQGATLIHTLNKASPYYTSGDTNGNGILDTTETWTWTNVPSNAINGLTTFEARGFGTDSLLNEVSYAAGNLGERDTVDVDTIEPDTVTTIVASAALVQSGDTVDLTVTEDNTGDDPLTNPYVEVRQGATLIHTLNKASAYYTSGDTNGNGILDTTEIWTWTNVPSNPITGVTVFEALGFGTDSLGNEVSHAEGNTGERDTVTVNTLQPGTIVTITSSAATVSPGETVLLTVTEDNTGGVPLTNPYVEVRQGATLIHTLNKASAYYTSGDTNGDGILDTTETWTWTNVPSNAINAATTFEALGFGTDTLGNPVSWPTYPGERDTVRVEVRGEGCLEICKFQDSNVNSMWDPGEPWLPDWKFHVTGPGYDTWVTTGPEGCVVLLDLTSGTYTVTEELKAGWYNTKPGGDAPYEQKVTVGISTDCARVVFGNREEIRDIPPMVPAVGEWGIIAMIILFAGLLVWTVRRKQLAS